jgi:hypothetical protein
VGCAQNLSPQSLGLNRATEMHSGHNPMPWVSMGFSMVMHSNVICTAHRLVIALMYAL